MAKEEKKKVVKKNSNTKKEVKKKPAKKDKIAKEKEIKVIEDKQVKSKITEEKEEDDKKRKYLIIILLLLLLCIFGISITFGKDIYEAVSEQVIEVLNLRKPTAPKITGGSKEWSKERLIKVEKDAEAKDGLSYYEYCVREEESTKNCEWKKTETKNVKVTETGKYYVTFRAVDKEERRGYNSNTEVVYIDNNNPVIKDIKIKETTTNSISIEVEAKDEHSGIKSYSYSLDGKTYEEGKLSYMYSNLEANTEYTIYIKVEDKVGNNIVLSMQVKTSIEDNTCTINCDTDSDGKCDINCDTNNDGKCDLNCDTNHDGKCDLNCDTNNDEDKENKPEPTPTPGIGDSSEGDNKGEDLVIPEINLDKVPTEFLYGSKYDLPSYYKFGPTGGEVECKVREEIYKDTQTLGIGTHIIECIAKGNNGINVRVSKKVEVKVETGIDEAWDGWIKLNLYYPENSTNWEWRIGREWEIRDGYENTEWQPYTGPILVKLEDVDDVYIRYELDGEIYVVAPNGKVAVDIVPDKYTLNNGEKTKVEIYYDKDAINKEYKIGNGNWQEYTGSFEVGVNTIIEARGTKEEKVYDSEGNYLYTNKRKGTDSVFISEYVVSSGGTGSTGGTISGSGTTPGGGSGSTSYGPVVRENGTTTTAPVTGSKPSTYLAGPDINSNPSTEIVESVKVTVTPQEEAEKVYISISGNSYQEYTDSVEIKNNTVIRAYYIRKSDGKISDTSYYYVQNIKQGNKPYVRIDATPNSYLSQVQEEVEVQISGSNYDTLEYSLDGEIYSSYTNTLMLRKSSTVYARGTNSYGTTIEKLSIPTVIPPVQEKELNISIFTNPTNSEGLINKTEVSIIYDSNATKKYYKLAGDLNYKEYTEPFELRENTTIYAYATGENSQGSASKGVDFLTTGIMEPIINVSPSQAANMVKVTITFDKNASKKYYQINNGEKFYYTGSFEIYENSEIYAYNSNTLGYEADSSYEISNIVDLPNYLVIDKGKYYIIKLNYPENSTPSAREYKWKPDGVWKVYDEQGILLIKPEYKDEFDFDSYDGIKVEDESGNEVIFTDHYYLIDVPFSELSENLFMRWDSSKPKGPQIMFSPNGEPTKEVEIGIIYPNSQVNRYYKIVKEDGTDSGWMKYTGSFKVTDNNSIIYAKGETLNKSESEVSSLQITNIDKIAPVITVKGDTLTPKQQVTVTVEAIDNMMISEVRWAQGEHTKDYFKNNGTSIPSVGRFTVTENGKYTIYANDQVGNEIVKVIEITNIDKSAPDIIINVLTERLSPKAEVSIDYGDSTVKEYKIGENGNYQKYTENLIISSYDVSNLANDDGSLTIYARGTDDAGNTKEVNEIIYILDLDIPVSSRIIASEGYPTLTKDGMIEETESYIVYDTTRDDLINYYRIDEGEWTLYNGPITIKEGTIEAKSVKEKSGLTVTSKAKVVVPNDAVNGNTYDNNLETSSTINANTTRKFTLLNNLMGRKVRVYINGTPDTNATIKVYDKENNELSNTTIVNPVTVFEIPEDGYKVAISAGKSKLEVREITLRAENVIIDKNLVPIISINDSEWTVEKVVNIKYPEGNYIKEYSIDNGENWIEYVSPFKVGKPLKVIARVVKVDKVVSGSTFAITKIDAENPDIRLDISRVQLGYDQELPTYYKLGTSGGNVECKVGDTKVTNTNELELGSHKIVCTVNNNVGKSKTISKTVQVTDTPVYQGDSILEILERDDIITGRYNLEVNDEIYPVHLYTYDENQHWTENQTFGDANDVATADTYAQNMVIVKVNGDVTIDEGVTVGPYYDENYGGPKGFTLYVTGTLTNNGTIDNSHGAKAEGQNVYLWKNADGTYEYVPAEGGAGARGAGAGAGITGTSGTGRQTGGGGSGGYKSAAGSAGTSYSGGTGGGSGGNVGTGAGAGSTNGGRGGTSASGGAGAGNPGGSANAGNGTGGLLTIYADSYKNTGTIIVIGAEGEVVERAGGSSGGGSINIFTNQDTGIDQLGVITDTRYKEILGIAIKNGGSIVGSGSYKGGAGGAGTVNIGEIRNGQYYDLKEVIEQDKEAYIKSVTIKGDSILSILEKNDLKNGYYYFVVNGENYPVHLYTYDENQHWTENQTFGDANDVATADTYAQNMVIVKVNGDVTIDEGVTVGPYYDENYGGPKGFTLYVTGTLTNNGTIDNSHGAKAEGQNVYLWKNADGTYEYVPAVGAAGAGSARKSDGKAGTNGSARQTGGGGSGGSTSSYSSGIGGTGTSYSGGTGSGAGDNLNGGNGSSIGGAGGSSSGGSGGAGNPGGYSTSYTKGSNGTGGLLIIYADNYVNNGTVSAKGSLGGNTGRAGGSSGGGSINVFYVSNILKGNVEKNGGSSVTSSASFAYKIGGAGGSGTVTYTQIPQIIVTSTYSYPTLTSSNFDNDYHLVNINYLSTLTKKLYSIDNGTTWLNYTEPFKIESGAIVLAKGTKSDGTETEVITYEVPTPTDNLLLQAYDNNLETSTTITANTSQVFTLSGDLLNKSLRFLLSSIPASDASIKIYNTLDEEILSTTFIENLTVITIPENSYKIVINSGSSDLSISEINIREAIVVKDNIPVIETSSVDWTPSKTVEITYPDGDYVKEYSLDLGKTWQEYLSPITVDKPITILTRTVENGKVISSSSFTITKIDNNDPTITLDIPEEIVLGTEYNLPTSYTVDETKSGGSTICKIGEEEVITTKDLAIGTYEITCTVTTGAGKTSSITKTINIIDETVDITLEIPDSILVGSDYNLPTSVTGSNYVCKVGDTEYTNTKDLEVGTHEIVCSVTSIGGNTKEVIKQIEVYEETSSEISEEVTEEENSNLEEGELNE